MFLVLVLSPEDGRQHIVETAVGVCKAVLQNRVKMEDINIDLIDRKLTGELDITGYTWLYRHRGRTAGSGNLIWSWSALHGTIVV